MEIVFVDEKDINPPKPITKHTALLYVNRAKKYANLLLVELEKERKIEGVSENLQVEIGKKLFEIVDSLKVCQFYID